MSQYISCVGKSRVYDFSFDIHENKDGSASIRPNKLGDDLPKATWLTYESVDAAMEYIESVCGDLSGAQRAMQFWEKSGIGEKMQAHMQIKAESAQISKMTEAQKEYHFAEKQYQIDQEFIEESNYFL